MTGWFDWICYFTLGAGDVDVQEDGRRPRVLNVGLEFPLSWYTLTRGWEDGRTEYLEEAPNRSQVRRARLIVADHLREGEIDQLTAESPGEWHKQRYYHRPGIYAFVWYPRELWDRYQAAGGRKSSPWPRPPADDLPPPSHGPR